MKKIINMIKKNIFGVIIGLMLGSVSIYAATKFSASDVLVNTPTGSNLGSNATLQNSLDELYSIADKYDELNKKIDSMLDKMYPVGSIYISTDITNSDDVAKKFGGTWEAYGSGRTLVGVGTGTDSNSFSKTFNAGSIGGEYTHTLSINEMPSHTHTFNSGGKSLNINTNSQHSGIDKNLGFAMSSTGSFSGGHNINTSSISNTGGGKEHNNIQPYIVVYMYKRTK